MMSVMEDSSMQQDSGSARLKNRDKCAYCGMSRAKDPSRSYFKFPKDPVRCQEWVSRCKMPYLERKSLHQLHTSHKLCSNHFQEDDFVLPSRHRLKSTAVPVFHCNPSKLATDARDNTLDISTLKLKLADKISVCTDAENIPYCSESPNAPRLMLWLKTLGQEKLLEKCTSKYVSNNAKICEDHFEERHFTSTLRDRLNKNVVPLPVVSLVKSDAELSGENVIADLDFEVNSDENVSDEESLLIPPSSDVSDKALNSFGSEDIFGKYVASELRALKNNPLLYLQTKQSILESITRANFELLRS